MKHALWLTVLIAFIIPLRGYSAGSLQKGYGRATWGMSRDEFLSVYQMVLTSPRTSTPEGVWAVEGPAPGELTVSGVAIGEEQIRSVSLGFHPKWGLSIIHIRLNKPLSPASLDTLIPLGIARYGPPQERLPGQKVVWEDGVTHIEYTIHRVSPLHSTPSDHLAIVLWSISLMSKIDGED